jgi:hypothetical protein
VKPYKAVVCWEDAYHRTTDGVAYPPEDFAEAYNPHIVDTLGWVVVDTPHVIAVSMFSLRGSGGFRNALYIPRGMVSKISRLK